jgi:3-carboxy-cis,cis-muconate cycloisomerase
VSLVIHDGLLTPGAHRAKGLGASDLIEAMLRVEVAWMRALAHSGAALVAQVEEVTAAVSSWRGDPVALATAAEGAGNPVVPLVAMLRQQVAEAETAQLIHRGLTSQDVLDTAIMLLARRALARVESDLDATASVLADLAARHRDTVMAGRTLTQYAVPITFGFKVARWLSGVIDAKDAIAWARASLPAQCGGAAGTLALLAQLVPDPARTARVFALDLGLVSPIISWHTVRTPVTRVGDALVQAVDALGVIASDAALLVRPEVAELRESAVEGRGSSSTMPHKRNPVLTVLIRAAAMQAPLLGAQLHLAAAQAADERPDGAWHAEWPAMHHLLVLAVTAASQAHELAEGLEVDAERMAQRAGAASAALLAEREGQGSAPRDTNPKSYLGMAGVLVDDVLARYTAREKPYG